MNPVHRLIGPAEAPHASTLRRNGAPPRRERTACRCLAVAIARSKDPSACIISDETFSKAEPYGIMLRREAAPFKAITDRVSVDYTEARRSRRSTGSGSNRRSRPIGSISTRRCHLSCATRLRISPTARNQRATSAERTVRRFRARLSRLLANIPDATFRELSLRACSAQILGLPNEITPLPKHRPTADAAARSVQPAHVGCC